MVHLLLALQVVAQHDALRYDVTLIPSDTSSHLLGEVETTWRLGSSEPVIVRLDSSMRVVRVLVDGRPNTRLSRTLYARSANDVLVPHEKPAGDSITTRVRYHGFARVGQDGVGPRLAPDPTGRPSFVAATGSAAQFLWLPIPELPDTDRTLATFRIQAPISHRAIAPGQPVKIDTLPYGDAIWHYRLDLPVPIAALGAASGQYAARTRGGACGRGCEQVEVWRFDSAASDSRVLQRAAEMARFMADRAGPYPYGRLVHVQTSSPTLVAAPGVVFHPQRAPGDGTAELDPSLVLMGTARQWFGVTLVARHEDRWITDGLASYFSALHEDPTGKRADRVTQRGPSSGIPDFRRLHRTMGDSAFFRGVARVVEEHRGRLVTRTSFLRVMSAVAGRELDSLFPRP